MTPRLTLALALVFALPALSACAPLIVGGVGAIAADAIVEQEQGGDGLF